MVHIFRICVDKTDISQDTITKYLPLTILYVFRLICACFLFLFVPYACHVTGLLRWRDSEVKSKVMVKSEML